MLKRLLPVCAAALYAAATPAHAERFDHVFLIMMENHGTGQIIGNTVDAPFINSLAKTAQVAMNYHGVTHPEPAQLPGAAVGLAAGHLRRLQSRSHRDLRA